MTTLNERAFARAYLRSETHRAARHYIRSITWGILALSLRTPKTTR
jgi:hypothetical protein